MNAPDEPEENLSLAALVEKLRKGEPVDPAAVARLRSELKARFRANAVTMARLGGSDGKAEKAAVKKIEREVSRLRRPENRGDGE